MCSIKPGQCRSTFVRVLYQSEQLEFVVIGGQVDYCHIVEPLEDIPKALPVVLKIPFRLPQVFTSD